MANDKIDPTLTAEHLAGWVIAFGVPWAVEYGKKLSDTPLALHHSHYDILERCGARMDDFHRIPEAMQE